MSLSPIEQYEHWHIAVCLDEEANGAPCLTIELYSEVTGESLSFPLDPTTAKEFGTIFLQFAERFGEPL